MSVPLSGAVASGSSERQVGDVGVGFALPTERRHLSMARDEAHLVTQWPEPFRDRLHELGVISAGKVGPADGALEENIADQRKLRFGMKEHHVTWSMTPAEADREVHLSDVESVPVLQPAIGLAGLTAGKAVALSLLSQA